MDCFIIAALFYQAHAKQLETIHIPGHQAPKGLQTFNGSIQAVLIAVCIISAQRPQRLVIGRQGFAVGENFRCFDDLMPPAKIGIALRRIAQVVDELKNGVIDQLLQEFGLILDRVSRAVEIPGSDNAFTTTKAQDEQNSVGLGLEIPFDCLLIGLEKLIDHDDQFRHINTLHLQRYAVVLALRGIGLEEIRSALRHNA